MKRGERARRCGMWLGLSLGLGVCGLWVASRSYAIEWWSRTTTFGFQVHRGAVGVWQGWDRQSYSPPSGFRVWRPDGRSPVQWWFGRDRPPNGGAVDFIPLWPVAGGLLVASGLMYRARREAWRCGACGYDRRGIAAGRVCPECGAAR